MGPATKASASCTGLVLAAGEGRRFGGPKQLAELEGRPLLEHALAALRPAVGRVVVVLGARAAEIRANTDLRGVETVVCADWAKGLSASVRCGLAALAGAGEVVVTLADQPFLSPTVVAHVLAAPGDAARATYRGEAGHPVVLRGALLRRAGELSGDAGFRNLLGDATRVECGHLGDPRDIDTPGDLAEARGALPVRRAPGRR